MNDRQIHDEDLHAHFVTFSCYRRRKLLDHPVPRRIVTDSMGEQLMRLNGRCLGFVVMPDHVHSLIWFTSPGRLSEFMKQWKRTSSYRLKKQLVEVPAYAESMSIDDPIWQPRYYDFNVESDQKLREKLEYMHRNPVRAGLVEHAEHWHDSSARHYLLGERFRFPLGWDR